MSPFLSHVHSRPGSSCAPAAFDDDVAAVVGNGTLTFRENNTVVESTSGSHAVCLLTHGGFTTGKVRNPSLPSPGLTPPPCALQPSPALPWPLPVHERSASDGHACIACCRLVGSFGWRRTPTPSAYALELPSSPSATATTRSPRSCGCTGRTTGKCPVCVCCVCVSAHDSTLLTRLHVRIVICCVLVLACG
jgi:hypothetical protein